MLEIVRKLPGDVPAAFCVVIHTPPYGRGALAHILARNTGLDVASARDGEAIAPGTIRVASPDRHLMVRDGHLDVVTAPRENGHRPAIDPLFRSAARAYRRGCISVLLSGTLDDGSAGTVAVRFRGGTTIVQDPGDALFPDMPSKAIKTACVDHVVSAADIPGLLGRLVSEPLPSGEAVLPDSLDAIGTGGGTDRDHRAGAAALEVQVQANREHPAPPGCSSDFSCPACGGVLFEQPGPVTQFLCRVGHRYSPDTLTAGQHEVVEEALWTALRTLEERASLSDRLADRAVDRADVMMEERFRERGADDRERSDQIRAVLRAVLPAPDDPRTEVGGVSEDSDAVEGPA